MRLYLHIGTDKTGSTSIQGHLHANRSWMLDQGVYLPTTGLRPRNGHRELLSNLAGDDLDVLTAELEQASRQGYDAAVLSWEGMGFFDSEQIALLHAAIAAWPVTVVVYVREQADIIQSGFLELAKWNSNHYPMRVYTFPRTFSERRVARHLRKPAMRDYHKMLCRYQAAFPGSDIRVREYDRQALAGGDVVEDFFGQLGLPVRGGFQRAELEDNISIDVECALALEGWQEAGWPAEKLSAMADIAYSMVARHGPSTRYFLDEKAVKSIRRHYRRSNRRLARDFMPGRNYPFLNEKPCWRTETFDRILERSRERANAVLETYATPTLRGASRGGGIAAEVLLSDGWCAPADWGVWSSGERSTLRFRMMRRAMQPMRPGIMLVIGGRYSGDNTATRVSVNGQDFGQHNLACEGGARIRLPLDALGPYEQLEVSLEHQRPVSPRELGDSLDGRQLAFGLTELQCYYLQSDETGEIAPRRTDPDQGIAHADSHGALARQGKS